MNPISSAGQHSIRESFMIVFYDRSKIRGQKRSVTIMKTDAIIIVNESHNIVIGFAQVFIGSIWNNIDDHLLFSSIKSSIILFKLVKCCRKVLSVLMKLSTEATPMQTLDPFRFTS